MLYACMAIYRAKLDGHGNLIVPVCILKKLELKPRAKVRIETLDDDNYLFIISIDNTDKDKTKHPLLD
jgi:bifunctional DNA-binding transcriptional regulator/antitoxin component of YhaV-PrlF toxin-antitoxin module